MNTFKTNDVCLIHYKLLKQKNNTRHILYVFSFKSFSKTIFPMNEKYFDLLSDPRRDVTACND